MMAKKSAINTAKALLIGKKKPRGKRFAKGSDSRRGPPFPAGNNANPGGRPGGEKFETTLQRYLERDSKEVSRLASIAVTDATKLEGISFQDALVLRTLAAYYNDPNGAFFSTLRETKEGKLVDKSEGNQKLSIHVTYDRDETSTNQDIQPTSDEDARDAIEDSARGAAV